MGFLIRFPLVFAINYLGASAAADLLAVIPDWLMHSFEIMGGILPALGFAITIMVIGKKSMIPFFLIGYFAMVYFGDAGLTTMAMAIFGTCFALILRMIMFRKEGVLNE